MSCAFYPVTTAFLKRIASFVFIANLAINLFARAKIWQRPDFAGRPPDRCLNQILCRGAHLWMKHLLFWLTTLTLVSCGFLGRDIGNRPVVRVNSTTLSAKEFGELLANQLREYDALTVKNESLVSRTKESLISGFIVQVVSSEYARDHGLIVKKMDLEAEINLVRSSYPDDLSFRKALSDQRLSYEDWKNKVRGSLLQKLVAKKLGESLPDPTPEEIKNFYESNKSLFSVPEKIRITQIVLKSEKDAKMIQDELEKGRKLSELAREYSIAPESAQDGDVGWVERGTLDVFDKAFSLKTDTISTTIRSPYGFHIIQVKGRTLAKQISLEEAKTKIIARLIESRQQIAYSQWLENEIKKAVVFRDDEIIKKIRVETRH